MSEKLSWTQRNPVKQPPARRGAMMAFDEATKSVVLFGGVGSKGMLNDTWSWDGRTWLEHHQKDAPTPRAFGATSSGVGSQGIVLFGGVGADGSVEGDTWVWNGSASLWTQMHPSSSPPARSAASLAPEPSADTLLLFGGEAGRRIATFWDD